MPIIRKTASLAAGATVDNVLSGSAFEYLPQAAHIQFAVIGSATGLVATVQSGSDVLQEEAPISTANRFGLFPDDFDLTDVAAGGDRLIVKVRNTSGGALTYFVTAKVDFI